jgi:hypothetical protein
MIGEAAFHPLKASGQRPESSRQAETALAWVFKILLTGLAGRAAKSREGKPGVPRKTLHYPFGLNCRQFPRDMANWGDFAVLLFGSQY